jgi:hypothetical protein
VPGSALTHMIVATPDELVWLANACGARMTYACPSPLSSWPLPSPESCLLLLLSLLQLQGGVREVERQAIRALEGAHYKVHPSPSPS